jgi:hypothetical protein
MRLDDAVARGAAPFDRAPLVIRSQTVASAEAKPASVVWARAAI